jgi:ABC-type glycerol-3-phosphate transport system substrate-binding protein
MIRHFAAPLAAVLLAAGCGLLPDPTVRLATGRAEVAAYVERYNARQDEFRVEVRWRDSPAQAVLDGEAFDVVIGEELATASVMDRLESLGDVVKPGRLDPAGFYPGLLAMGSRDNRPLAVPISFDLPAMVFLRGALPQDLPSLAIGIETIRNFARPVNSIGKGGGLSTVGFSPLWNREFLLLSARLFGARLRAGRAGALAWDPAGLQAGVDFVRSWIAEDNGGAALDRAFAERNLVQPWERLLASRKILFALMPFTEFLALPEEKRRDLDYRWLARENAIPVRDTVLFAAVPRAARNKRGAKAFLEWFAGPAAQRELAEVNRSLRLGVFGVTSGFPALIALNEKDLPQVHPSLLGRVPAAGMLSFPEPLPSGWRRMRDEAVLPWLERAASGAADAGSLEDALLAWQRTEGTD